MDVELNDGHDSGLGTVHATALTIPGGDSHWWHVYDTSVIVASGNAATAYAALGDAIAAFMDLVADMPVPGPGQ